MASFAEKLTAQTEVEKAIEKVFINFKKEPKRGLNKIHRVKQWYDRVEELYKQFWLNHEELTKNETEFFESEYFTSKKFEAIQTQYNNMTTKIKKILTTLEPSEELTRIDSTEVNMVSGHSSVQESSSSSEDEDEHRPEQSDKYKTPLRTPRYGVDKEFPNFVSQYANLRNKAEETVARFKVKTKRFDKELNIIESYIMDGLRARARFKEMEKRKNDLDDGIDEQTFIMGDGVERIEDEYNMLIMRYRQIVEEVGTTELITQELIHLKSNRLKFQNSVVHLTLGQRFRGYSKQWSSKIHN